MDGIPDEEKESNEQCKMKLFDILTNTMNIQNVRNLQIVRCHRLGKFNKNANRPCTVIFKLQWFGDQEEIWARHTAFGN